MGPPEKQDPAHGGAPGLDDCDLLDGTITHQDNKTPLSTQTDFRFQRLILDAWKADLLARMARLELCQEYIGLTIERVEDLEHEIVCFKRVCELFKERGA